MMLRIMQRRMGWAAYVAVFTAISLAALPSLAHPQRLDRLASAPENFSPESLKPRERRVIQIGMAAAGDYLGLLDGSWGRGSRKAFEAYGVRRSDASSPRALAATAAGNGMIFIEGHGFRDLRFDEVGATVLLPMDVLEEASRASKERLWESADGGLTVELLFGALPQELHEGYAEAHPEVAPYLVRRKNRWVTVRNRADGTGLYIRSDRVGARWVTFLYATADRKYVPLARVMASGFYVGPRRTWLQGPTPFIDRLKISFD